MYIIYACALHTLKSRSECFSDGPVELLHVHLFDDGDVLSREPSTLFLQLSHSIRFNKLQSTSTCGLKMYFVI